MMSLSVKSSNYAAVHFADYLQENMNYDVLMFTIKTFCYVYNVKTVGKIVVKFFQNSHYCKFVLRSSHFLQKI